MIPWPSPFKDHYQKKKITQCSFHDEKAFEEQAVPLNHSILDTQTWKQGICDLYFIIFRDISV